MVLYKSLEILESKIFNKNQKYKYIHLYMYIC